MPGVVAMETAVWKEGTGSCDSVVSMSSTHSDDSLDYFTPDVRATLMFLEATIESLEEEEEEEDSGLSTDELETHTHTLPHSAPLPDKLVNICMPTHTKLEDVSRYHDDPNQVKGRDHKPSLSYMVPTPLLLANGASFLRRSTSSAADHKRQPPLESRLSVTEPLPPMPELRPVVTEILSPAPETPPSVPELQPAVPEARPAVPEAQPTAQQFHHSTQEVPPSALGPSAQVTEPPATPGPQPTTDTSSDHVTETPSVTAGNNITDAEEVTGPPDVSTDPPDVTATPDPVKVGTSEDIAGAAEMASDGPAAPLEAPVDEPTAGAELIPDNNVAAAAANTEIATVGNDAKTSDTVEANPVNPVDYPVTIPDTVESQAPERALEGCGEVGEAGEPSGESGDSPPILEPSQSSATAPLETGLGFIPPPMDFMDEPLETDDSDIPEPSEIPETPKIPEEPSEIPEAPVVSSADVSLPPSPPDAPVQVSSDVDTGFPASDIPEPVIPAADVPAQSSADTAFPVSEIPAPVIPAADVPAQNSPAMSFPVSDIPAPVISSSDIPSPDSCDVAFPPSDIPPPVVPPIVIPMEEIPVVETQSSNIPDLVIPPPEIPEIPAPDSPIDIIPGPDVPTSSPPVTDSPDATADSETTVSPIVQSPEDSEPATTLPAPVVSPLLKSPQDSEPPTTTPAPVSPIVQLASEEVSPMNLPATQSDSVPVITPPVPVSPQEAAPATTPPAPQSIPVPTTLTTAQSVPVPTSPPAVPRGPLTYSELEKLKKKASMKKAPEAIPVVQVRRPAAPSPSSSPVTDALPPIWVTQQGDPKSPPAVAPKPKKLPPNITIKSHKEAAGGAVHLDPKKVHMEALRKLGLLRSTDADPTPGPASTATGPSLSPRSRRSWAPPQSPLTSPGGRSCGAGPPTPEINPQPAPAPAHAPIPETPSPPQTSPAPPRKMVEVCLPTPPSGEEGVIGGEEEDRLDVPDHLPPSPPSTPTPTPTLPNSSDDNNNNNNSAPRCHGISVQISPLSDTGERRAALRRLGLGQD